MAALLHWFRTDLRLHDNPALQASLARAEREGQAWVPACWAGERWSGESPWGIPRAGEHRQVFLNQALADPSRSLQTVGNGLLVLRGPSPTAMLGLDRSVGAVPIQAVVAPLTWSTRRRRTIHRGCTGPAGLLAERHSSLIKRRHHGPPSALTARNHARAETPFRFFPRHAGVHAQQRLDHATQAQAGAGAGRDERGGDGPRG